MHTSRYSNSPSFLKFAFGIFLGTVLCFLNKKLIRTECNFTSLTEPLNMKGERKQVLLIGVMTAEKYLSTRARAIFDTWQKACDKNWGCQVVFFSSIYSVSQDVTPLVRLPGIDDHYPPQNKSFRMLKYMYDHYIDQFEWFVRVDDDIYLQTDKLERFLSSFDSTRPHFIGHACQGRKYERSKLQLGKGGFYCCGGAGMVFSNAALRMFAPHIEYCMRHLFSTHEDIEVSRCVRRFAGLLCSRSYEVASYFHLFKYPIKLSVIGTKVFRKTITLHPVKDFRLQYELQENFYRSNIKENLEKEQDLHKRITEMGEILEDRMFRNGKKLTNIQLLHLMNNFQTPKEHIGQWNFIPELKIRDLLYICRYLKYSKHLKDITNTGNTEIINHIRKYCYRKLSNVCKGPNQLYVYKRLNPRFHVEYIVDIPLSGGKRIDLNTTTVAKWHREYIKHTFEAVEFFEIPMDFTLSPLLSMEKQMVHPHSNTDLKNIVIHFVLPLSGMVDNFRSFMQIYEKVCLQSRQATRLHVSIMNDVFNKSSVLLDTIKQYQVKYGQKYVNMSYTDKPFARAEALSIGLSGMSNDALLFFIDVDLHFDDSLLYRVRMNTVKGKQVYYPIVFRQYHPMFAYLDKEKHEFQIMRSNYSSNIGFWQDFGYGMVSLYKSDFISAHGFNTMVKGWGQEDVDLADKVFRRGLKIHRSVDTGLVHPYVPKTCDELLKKFHKYTACRSSKLRSLASQQHLTNLVRRFPDVILNP